MVDEFVVERIRGCKWAVVKKKDFSDTIDRLIGINKDENNEEIDVVVSIWTETGYMLRGQKAGITSNIEQNGGQ